MRIKNSRVIPFVLLQGRFFYSKSLAVALALALKLAKTTQGKNFDEDLIDAGELAKDLDVQLLSKIRVSVYI